ncbi:hypothetical protein O6R08_04265 [Cutibacterium equinum]|uniref:Tat pathway signal sequence domain protein n=1 Tax=Cutibacterium equinum TaxID=3016342 RepID=A0ABY7R218_9ACTN|nr:hypothetical protein [Cutibacterium equinum]WCC80703.1 hypothetical protein O6R08_04265 [Cutibacterium equinum]
MTTNIKRRTVVQGIAWSVPAVTAAVTVPAFAASTPVNPLSCAATDPVDQGRMESPKWKDSSLRLSFSKPEEITLSGGTRLAAPTKLTIANVGPTELPAGTSVGITAASLDASGIVRPNANSLTALSAKAVDATGRPVNALKFQSPDTRQTTMALGCAMEKGQSVTTELTWGLAPGAETSNLASLQFIARIITDASVPTYTEFQSPEVLGGTRTL